MPVPARVRLATVAAAVTLVGTGCAGCTAEAEPRVRTTAPAPAATPTTAAPTSTPATPAPVTPVGPRPSDGSPRRADLSVPALGLRDLRVVPYVGWTDDAAGTEIQDGGVAASPHGTRGGVGPGGIGSYQVTAHRNTAGGPFSTLPDLRRGDRVTVSAGGTTYTYEITRTRETSFRSAASLEEQRAAVPGRPGVAPTRAMIMLSTCATQEDHAEGNYWADELDNPEHRIDKIGVLVASTPTGRS